MTRQEAAAKARAARAAKRQTITLELDRAQALGLYQLLETSPAPAAAAIRRQIVQQALTP